MRYVSVPEAVYLSNPIDPSEPVPEPRSISFARAVKIAAVLAAQKGSHDAQELRDLVARFEAVKPGEVVELSDAQWEIVAPEFKRPTAQAFGTPWIFCGEPHMRAWLDAPTKRPAVMVADGVTS